MHYHYTKIRKGEKKIMSITQSLSDIQAMLKYVESLVAGKNGDQQEEHLKNIGQSTLDIINNVEALNTSLLSITEDVMTKHVEILEDSSEITKESLEALIQSIEENEVIQKQVHEEIQAIFNKYSKSVSKVMSYMTNNKKYQEEIVGGLHDKIGDINENISSVNEKVLSKNDMSSIMNEIGEQLRTIINTDAEINNRNQSMLTSINDNLLTAQELMTSSSDELQSIKQMYTESTSRLSVIDTKMEAMMKHVMGED